MTVAEWLSERVPHPPPALEARVTAVLAEELSRSAADAPILFLAAGERMLADLLHNNSTSRISALDLLTADALVTYAFEACSSSPSRIDDLAARAMARISAIGMRTP